MPIFDERECANLSYKKANKHMIRHCLPIAPVCKTSIDGETCAIETRLSIDFELSVRETGCTGANAN